MSKNSGCIVITKSGKTGRTYYREPQVNKKTVVHVVNEDTGEEIKLLCNTKSLKIISYVD